MSNEQKSSGGSPALAAVVGVVLMAGGFWLSSKVIHGEEGANPLPAVHDAFAGIEHSLGLPLDPGITVAAIGVLLIVFPVLKSFFIAPLAEAIHTRNSDLEQTFSEAENLRTQMQQMRSEYEQRLTATEADARQRIESQIKEAQSLRQSLMAEATERADELVRRAQQEIEAERDRVLTGIRTHVVDIALAAAEKVVSENMDNARNRKLVDDFVSQVEVAR